MRLFLKSAVFLPGEFSFVCRRYLSRMIAGSKWLPSEEGGETANSQANGNSGLAFVRCVDGDERLRISLKYVRPENNGVKYFNFERLKSEPLASTIQRMANNIQKEMKLGGKKTKTDKKVAKNGNKEASPAPEPVTEQAEIGSIALYKDGKELSPSEITNAEAWTTATELKIGDTAYPLVQNYPTVIVLQVCDTPLANYPVPVKCHLEFAELLDCQFEWFISCKNKAETKTTADLVGVLHKNWNKVAEGLTFLPSEADIGCNILLKCTPFQRAKDGSMIMGEPQLSQSLKEIATGPKECPFERRQKMHLPKYATPEERKSILRVASFNVLAECYTDMAGTQENLFPYCPQEYLDFNYRKLLLLKEIPGYEADLLCLQEVDRHVFDNDYLPLLASRGYNGRLTLKAREVKEGLALFYRRDRFELVELVDLFIGGVLDSDPEFATLNECMSKVPHIRETFVTRSSVLQLAHLIDKTSGKRLLVGNTHLYFHWSADNIRLLQAYVSVRFISRTKAAIKAKTGEDPIVLFCGDFNSDYRCGVFRLFTKGKIPGNFNEFYQGGKQNFIPDLGDLIQHDLKLFPASGTPEYTTFVAAFAACIDYVYAEKDRFEVVNRLPMYEEEEFMPYTACPNQVMGSDHFALCVDLKYKN